MLPFEAPTIFEQLPRFFFKMPRVVQDQKSKFESDELFRRVSRESEVRALMLFYNRSFFTIDFTAFLFEVLVLNQSVFVLTSSVFCNAQVRYTGFRDRPLQERQLRFQSACREGHTDLVSSWRKIFYRLHTSSLRG